MCKGKKDCGCGCSPQYGGYTRPMLTYANGGLKKLSHESLNPYFIPAIDYRAYGGLVGKDSGTQQLDYNPNAAISNNPYDFGQSVEAIDTSALEGTTREKIKDVGRTAAQVTVGTATGAMEALASMVGADIDIGSDIRLGEMTQGDLDTQQKVGRVAQTVGSAATTVAAGVLTGNPQLIARGARKTFDNLGDVDPNSQGLQTVSNVGQTGAQVYGMVGGTGGAPAAGGGAPLGTTIGVDAAGNPVSYAPGANPEGAGTAFGDIANQVGSYIPMQAGGPTNPPYKEQAQSDTTQYPVPVALEEMQRRLAWEEHQKRLKEFQESTGAEPMSVPPKDEGTIKPSPIHREAGPPLEEVFKYGPGQMPPYIKASGRTPDEDYYEPWWENFIEYFDPTGISSHDDARAAYDRMKARGVDYPNLDEGLDMFGAVPLAGKFKLIFTPFKLAKNATNINSLLRAGKKTWNQFLDWAGKVNKFDAIEDETDLLNAIQEFTAEESSEPRVSSSTTRFYKGGPTDPPYTAVASTTGVAMPDPNLALQPEYGPELKQTVQQEREERIKAYKEREAARNQLQSSMDPKFDSKFTYRNGEWIVIPPSDPFHPHHQEYLDILIKADPFKYIQTVNPALATTAATRERASGGLISYQPGGPTDPPKTVYTDPGSATPTDVFEVPPLVPSDFEFIPANEVKSGAYDRTKGTPARYFSDPVSGEPLPLYNLPEAEVVAERTPYNQLSDSSLLAGVTAAKPWFEAGNYEMGYRTLEERQRDLARGAGILEFTGMPGMMRTADRLKNDPADLFTFHGGLDALSFVPSTVLGSRGLKSLGQQTSPLVRNAWSLNPRASQLTASLNPKNLKSKSGVDWLKKWYSDPDFQRRYSNTGAYGPNPMQKHILKSLGNYQAKNYLDLLKDKGLNAYLKYFPNTSGLSYGVPESIYLNRPFFAPFNKKGLESVRTHELTHLIERNGSLLSEADKQALLKPFGFSNKQDILKNLGSFGDKKLDKYAEYFLNPTEIHARMNQGRFDLGLSPKDKFTLEMFDQISKTKNWYGMNRYIKDKKAFVDLMNNFWGVAPYVGTGYLGYKGLQGADSQKAYGGGLRRWFKEEWKDVKTGEACGRKSAKDSSRPYPYCRPSKKVSSKTPATTSHKEAKSRASQKTGPKRVKPIMRKRSKK